VVGAGHSNCVGVHPPPPNNLEPPLSGLIHKQGSRAGSRPLCKDTQTCQQHHLPSILHCHFPAMLPAGSRYSGTTRLS
jgi:hypothetical protein